MLETPMMVDATYRRVEALSAWAAARGHTLNELAHAWLLAQPQVCSVISGATRLEHVLHNAKAADWVLGAQDVDTVNELLLAETRCPQQQDGGGS